MERVPFKGAAQLRLYEEITKHWRKAAEQGYAKAQFELGVSYAEGQGLKQDNVRAFMWLSLAAAQGHENATLVRVKLKRRMTAQQIDDGYQMMREWKRYFPSKSPKNWAAKSAESVSSPRDPRPVPSIESDEPGRDETTPVANRFQRLI
ncbi:MAG: hypothetical protein AAF362_10605 [Pseudomonadota bacterium]